MNYVAAFQYLLLSSRLFSGVDFGADATSVKMDYLPIGDARVDPILRDDCLSDHVHTFYGPQSGVDPKRVDSSDKLELHTKLVATDVGENTGNVEENKSLYWHPTVYKYDRSTNTYTRDVMAQTSAYYIWETGKATAFPNGFRMIGGFDTDKSFASAECVNESPCNDGDCYTENDFFPSSKCDELEVSMTMPNCWDGISIDSPPAHTSHVMYSEESEFSGDCPPSHPIKLPQIQLFFRIMPYDGGWHTFSDSSGVFHADYVSGWDEEFLQNVLDNCENEGEGAMPNFFCEDFLTFRDAPKCTDEDACDFADPNLLEKIKAFQPSPLLDVKGTIAAEETEVVVGDLPRGTCNGSLIGKNEDSPTNAPNAAPTLPPEPTDSPVEPTESPVEPTESPVEPTPAPVPVGEPITQPPVTVTTVAPTQSPVEDNDNDNVFNDNTNCKDDSSFFLGNKQNKNCNWIAKRAGRVKKFCKRRSRGKKVSKSCPVSCKKCEDSVSFDSNDSPSSDESNDSSSSDES